MICCQASQAGYMVLYKVQFCQERHIRQGVYIFGTGKVYNGFYADNTMAIQHYDVYILLFVLLIS